MRLAFSSCVRSPYALPLFKSMYLPSVGANAWPTGGLPGGFRKMPSGRRSVEEEVAWALHDLVGMALLRREARIGGEEHAWLGRDERLGVASPAGLAAEVNRPRPPPWPGGAEAVARCLPAEERPLRRVARSAASHSAGCLMCARRRFSLPGFRHPASGPRSTCRRSRRLWGEGGRVPLRWCTRELRDPRSEVRGPSHFSRVTK